MKTVVPSYYNNFKCIADKCHHNCCIGWEIDIDEDTYALYSGLQGDFGRRLKEGIYHSASPCFKLDKNERCVFLNENGLCDIISTLGDGALCDICFEHPRFKNFYSGLTEIGLGLCCEEACRIILENTEKVHLITLKDDGEDLLTEDEKVFLNTRNLIFKILQDESLPYGERVNKVFEKYGIKKQPLSPADWSKVYFELERLDSNWDKYLEFLSKARAFKFDRSLEKVCEQLSIYFVFRHLSESLDDGMFAQRLAFCMHAVMIIAAIYENADENSKDILEICRMYSAEIEYSDENVKKIMSFLD